MKRFIFLMVFVAMSFSAGAAEQSCDELLISQASSEQNSWMQTFKSQWEAQKSKFSRVQQKRWSEALEHLIEDLEEVSESASTKDKTLKLHLEQAVAKLSEIEAAFGAIEQQDKKAKYFKQAYEAVWAGLTVHSHEIMDAKSKSMDYRRYFAILKTIAEFDENKAQFSFYKIRRAIEGRFSMGEFIRCKI